jgi:ketopantoate reductase
MEMAKTGGRMRTLIVGVGALGGVFGHHLALGGGEVSMLARPGSVAIARQGIALDRLRKARAPIRETFRPHHVFADVGEVKGDWDAVWLCVHSQALRDPLLSLLAARTGGATVVSIGMGIGDREALEAIWPAGQVVELFPSILAFAQKDSSGATAFWIPPGSRDISGNEARAKPIVEQLTNGGMPARFVGAVPSAPFVSAVNVPMAIAAELDGWSVGGGTSVPARRLALEAAREAVAIVARHLDVALPKPPTRFSVWLGDRLFALAAPFDTRAFTQQNYTKVADQTLEMLHGWIDCGNRYSLNIKYLTRLRDALIACRKS